MSTVTVRAKEWQEIDKMVSDFLRDYEERISSLKAKIAQQSSWNDSDKADLMATVEEMEKRVAELKGTYDGNIKQKIMNYIKLIVERPIYNG